MFCFFTMLFLICGLVFLTSLWHNCSPPDCKHIDIVNIETATVLTSVLMRRHHCFVLNMSGDSLLSLVKNKNNNILLFLSDSQTDVPHHLHFLTKAGTIQFSVVWSLAGAKGRGFWWQAGWQLPYAASYLPNYVVWSCSSDIQQSCGDKHKGGSRWGNGEKFPLSGLLIACSVSLSDSGVREKGKGFRYKLKYTEKRYPLSAVELGKEKRKSQVKLILKQKQKKILKIFSWIYPSSPFSLLF